MDLNFQLHVRYEKFLAVHRVSIMTLCECRVDCPFPYHEKVLGDNQAPPPPQYRQWVAYLNPLFDA